MRAVEHQHHSIISESTDERSREQDAKHPELTMDRHSSRCDERHLRQEHEKPGDRHKGVSEVYRGQRERDRPRRRGDGARSSSGGEASRGPL